MPEPDVDPLNWSSTSDQFGLSKSSSSMARALDELVSKIVEDDLALSLTEVNFKALPVDNADFRFEMNFNLAFN
jgi:hypothetical protein